MISIVIPCYNANLSLPVALASIVAQTFTDWECIVVDDGSTEPLASTVEEFADPRIRLIRHSRNLGRGAARETGISAARREFLAWQDADDWSYPTRLETQLDYMTQRGQLGAMGAGAAIVDSRDELVGVRGAEFIAERKLLTTESPPVIHPSLVLRRDLALKYPYRSFRTSEDFDFLTRALTAVSFANAKEILYCYREHQSQSARKYIASTATRVRVTLNLNAPLTVRLLRAGTFVGKALTYTTACALGLQDEVLLRRSRPPTASQHLAYARARAAVTAAIPERFRQSSTSNGDPCLLAYDPSPA